MLDPRVFNSERRIRLLEKWIVELQRDLDFANQRLDELQSQVEALEER
jgi:hypothetical protein